LYSSARIALILQQAQGMNCHGVSSQRHSQREEHGFEAAVVLSVLKHRRHLVAIDLWDIGI